MWKGPTKLIIEIIEIKISKRHQQTHETTKQHYYDIKKGNMLA
jgi:hypothetical protein